MALIQVVVSLVLVHAMMATSEWHHLQQGQTSVDSMTYKVKLTDQGEEFSVEGIINFSVKHKAYRFEFGEGSSKLFIYPMKGKGVFYYPKSDFENDDFNLTSCVRFKTPLLDYLPSPLLRLEGYKYVALEDHYGKIAEKYVMRNEYLGQRTEYEVWMEKDGKSMTRVLKKWEMSKGNGFRQRLYHHTVIQYFDFSSGEQRFSVWDRPRVACSTVNINDVSAVDVALELGLPPELLLPVDETRPVYKNGKNILTEPVADFEIKRPLPYSPELCDSIAKTLPETFDWRDFGAVTRVKNQRNCGSCWVFGAVGSLEGAYFLKHNSLVELSEQAMVDCAGSSTSDGCFGGEEPVGYLWVNRTGGIPPAEEYSPYQETNGNCRLTTGSPIVAPLEGYYQVQNDTEALKVALVTIGPIAVGVNVSSFPHDYKNGILPGSKCDYTTSADHSVLLVGYGESSEDGPYWIIKNSWGRDWGLEGYGLLAASGNGTCSVFDAYIPILK